jgi:L-asparaginase II
MIRLSQNIIFARTGKQLMTNPIIAQVTRGPIIESFHCGSFALCDASGKIVVGGGDIETPVYPRSAIKAFQCLPVIESGAAERFGLNDEEIALCCSSHNGEAEHVRVARSILHKCAIDEDCLECGAHWPSYRNAAFELVRAGTDAMSVHNNCSGKHAGMLTLAKQLGVPAKDYVKPEHAVQKAVASTIERMCDVKLTSAPMGVDGCSVPTWAIPLRNMAMGFARLCNRSNTASKRIIGAARAHPFMIAGTGRFDTRVMEAVPRVFIKTGAEGVYCGCIPDAGLGFALKCDDGAGRAAEVATASLLLKLDIWKLDEAEKLKSFQHETIKNWRKIEVGELHASL